MKPESEYILFATIKGLPGLGRAVFSVPKYPVSPDGGGFVWRAQSTVPTEKDCRCSAFCRLAHQIKGGIIRMKKLVSLLLMLVFVFSLSCAMAEGKKHVENLIVGTTAANNTFNMTTQSDAFGRMNYNGLTQGNYVYRDANGDLPALFFHQLRDFGRR